MKHFIIYLKVIILCFFSFSVSLSRAESDSSDAITSTLKNAPSSLKIYFEQNGIQHLNANAFTDIDSVTFESVSIDSVATEPTLMIRVQNKFGNLFSLPVDSIKSIEKGSNIPTLYIDTDPYVDEIPGKTDYMTASFRFVPYDGRDTVVSSVSIRGRGNSSWYFPKKPYRLKFSKKQSIGNLNKAKSFVLISNYIDNTLMRNVVAFKIAQELGMPYTNLPEPVNLVFNGHERGSYLLTNKVGINSGSVDIDENEGVLWELDTNYDEEFEFKCTYYNLPCMLKDPDLRDIADDDEEVERLWQFWKDNLEEAFYKTRYGNWKDAFDMESIVKFLLVNNLMENLELYWPKSMYLYKESHDGKYKFGPVWDFDWAMGYAHEINTPLLNNASPTYKFLKVMFTDKEFLKAFGEALEDFRDNHLQNVLEYIDEYAELIRDSALQDGLFWPNEHYNVSELNERNTFFFDLRVKELKTWLLQRIDLICMDKNFLLY